MIDMENKNQVNKKNTSKNNISNQSSSPTFIDPKIKIISASKSENKSQIQDKKQVGFVSSISISKEADELGKPINEPKKEIKEKQDLSIKKIIFNIFNYFKELPTRFVSGLPSNLQSLFYAILGTMIGFGFAILLFPQSPGFFAIFLTTLFLAPFIQKQIKLNELLVGRTEEVEKKGVSLFKFQLRSDKFSFIGFYNDHKSLFSTYLYFFLGIILVIILLVTIIPQSTSANLFGNQGWDQKLLPTKNIGFEGQDKTAIFWSIFTNNLSVLIVCFIIALVFPLGAILLIVWNAIYWGVVFTQYALFYSSFYHIAFIAILLPLLLSVALHVILEAGAYFFASMSGNLLAVGIKSEAKDYDRLFTIIKYCLILLLCGFIFFLAGALTEVYIFDILKNIFFSIF